MSGISHIHPFSLFFPSKNRFKPSLLKPAKRVNQSQRFKAVISLRSANKSLSLWYARAWFMLSIFMYCYAKFAGLTCIPSWFYCLGYFCSGQVHQHLRTIGYLLKCSSNAQYIRTTSEVGCCCCYWLFSHIFGSTLHNPLSPGILHTTSDTSILGADFQYEADLYTAPLHKRHKAFLRVVNKKLKTWDRYASDKGIMPCLTGIT